MNAYSDRLAALRQRCSGAAVEHLEELQAHPKFPLLVEQLEQLGGMIFRLDVEQHFVSLLKQANDGREEWSG